MATRKLEQIAERTKGKLPAAYDLSCAELMQLYDYGKKKGLCDAITTAFRVGFALGTRAEKAGKVNKRL